MPYSQLPTDFYKGSNENVSASSTLGSSVEKMTGSWSRPLFSNPKTLQEERILVQDLHVDNYFYSVKTGIKHCDYT